MRSQAQEQGCLCPRMDGIYPAKSGTTAKPSASPAAASQQYPGLALVFGLCLHQQWPNTLSLQMAEADVGMEISLVHFTAEELSHEA